MTWEQIVAQPAPIIVTKRYKVTKGQDAALQELSTRLNIPESALVRLAIDQFLPRTTNQNFKEEGIKNLWNDRKF